VVPRWFYKTTRLFRPKKWRLAVDASAQDAGSFGPRPRATLERKEAMPKKPAKSVSERVADADARGSAWLAKANELAEAGKKEQAQRCYDKGQFWLDRSNKLRGNH
jgi:hypothetical protein